MTDHSGTVLMIIGLLLMAAALCLTGYNFVDDRRAGSEAEEALAVVSELIADPVLVPDGLSAALGASAAQTEDGEDGPMLSDFISLEEVEYPPYILHPEIEMPVQTVNGKEYVAVISIPALDLELPVFSEWSYANLRSSACRYIGSAYTNDLVICAHNYDRHFGRLKTLSVGDQVIVTDMDGNVFTYEVAVMETLSPSSVPALTESEWDLTLFTCTVGGASRVTIRCEKTE